LGGNVKHLISNTMGYTHASFRIYFLVCVYC
jgi:hypothetical protein